MTDLHDSRKVFERFRTVTVISSIDQESSSAYADLSRLDYGFLNTNLLSRDNSPLKVN